MAVSRGSYRNYMQARAEFIEAAREALMAGMKPEKIIEHASKDPLLNKGYAGTFGLRTVAVFMRCTPSCRACRP